MEEIKKDRLGTLFGEMKPEAPTDNFEKVLMSRISARANNAARKKLRMQWLHMLLWPSLGVAAIVGILWIIGRVTGIDFALNMPAISLEPSPEYHVHILLAVLVLALLIADTLIRKHLNHKRAAADDKH